MSTQQRRHHGFRIVGSLVAPGALLLACACGCTWDDFQWVKPPPPPPPPAESFTLRGDKLEAETRPEQGTPAGQLAGAQDLYRQGEYEKAEKIFHKIAENTKNPPPIAEEARYYEAECLRRQSRYPKAADTYNRMLNDFPSGAYREQAVQHMFEIANYWLDDTRKAMREDKDGKSWEIWPEALVPHLDKTKPLLDEEGRALEKLEQVRYNDMNGPLADQALFLYAATRFREGDYKDAERSFSQLVEMYPNSRFVNDAIKQALISKQLCTGGAAYDSRKLAEARLLVDSAYRNYPDLASKESPFLDRQLFSITMQQAEKDYQVAEFYKRTGHPCSAYFCYEVVRRRYPGTKYCDMATEQMKGLRSKLEKAQQEEDKKRPSGDAPDVVSPGSLPGNLMPGQPNFLPGQAGPAPR